ncbi:hypothetical protein FQN54_000361 [Arachnomyces sp. PD_36]|nr:hypothetical protein FQN54_000361 [Arachnomyces sp. PD_36]
MATQINISHNLPEKHLPAFETLLKLCADKGLRAQPAGLTDDEVRDGLNDETTLSRYLCARGFNPDQALKQFQEAVTAHRTNQISTRYNEIEVSDFETARSLYPHWCGRRTKDGLPICILDIGHLNRSTLAEYEKTRRAAPETSMTAVQRASIAHDYLTRFVFPLCTAMQDRPKPTVPITRSLYLIDLATFTMKQGWDVKNWTSDIGQLLMTGYPEIIDRILVLNAPSYFAMMWGIMRKWLDPGTADKLAVLTAGEMLPTLEKYIDMESIPSRFGGKFDWDHGMPLDLDAGIKAGLEWEGEKELPRGPLKWVLDEAERKTAVSVGSIDGVARTARVARVKVDEISARDPEKRRLR